ncbi:MAG TPA: hypothetical protein DEV73_04460 [Candidatus Zambryskibacteria bacterium]|nr:hypothetical protein [Candidatus Zambryskibacteria bacterium]
MDKWIKWLFRIWILTIIVFVLLLIFAANKQVTVPGQTEITPLGRLVISDVILGISAFTFMVFLKAIKKKRFLVSFILTFSITVFLLIFGLLAGDGKVNSPSQKVNYSESSSTEPTPTATIDIIPKSQPTTTKKVLKTGDLLPNGKIYVDPNNLPSISNIKVLNLVNQYRSKNGSVPWEVSSELCSLAEKRAVFLFANNMEQANNAQAGSHPGFNETTSEYAKDGWIGENISRNPLTNEGAFKSWVDSPPHEAMLHWDWIEGSHITKACVANRVGVGGSVVVLLVGYK